MGTGDVQIKRLNLFVGLRPALLRHKDLLAVAAWAALVAGAFLWGERLINAHSDIALNAPPLFGHFELVIGWAILPPLALGVAAVWFGPRVAARLRFGHLLLAVVVTSALWALAVAASRGVTGITDPLRSRFEYLAAVPLVRSPALFLHDFVAHISTYPLHVQGHPPGIVLILWLLAAAGLGGAVWASLLVVIAGASAGAAALIALRAVASESVARRAAPFVAVSPAALWIATSADAFYLGASAWAIAGFVLAASGTGRASDLRATGAGILVAITLFLSYGLALLLAPLVLGSAIVLRRVRPLVIAGLAGAAVFAGFAAAGFWWPAGLAATVDRYHAGIAESRPYSYFVVSNLAAFGLALGPATAAAVTRLRASRVALLAAAGLTAALLADVSGLSKGEVERIWLPFGVWVLTACAFLPSRRAHLWLGLQVATTIALQIVVKTPW